MQKLGWSLDNSAKERGHTDFGVVGDATPRDLIIDLNSVDTASVQLVWGGTLTAAVTVWFSNSFIPDARDLTSATPQRAGTWTDVTAAAYIVKTGADPAGGPLSQYIHVPVATPGFMRVRVIRSAGSGQLDAFDSGKTVGR
jgi:hypothetical protein